MKTIEEIFANNPELKETPEFKEVYNTFKEQYMALRTEYWKYYDKVTEIAMHSDIYVIGGLNPNDAIEKILEIDFKLR